MALHKRRRSTHDDYDAVGGHFQNYLDKVIATVVEHPAEDPIREAPDVQLEYLEERADDLFVLADQKIRVFPFSQVKPCWFRLYTDTSIIKAVRKLRSEISVSDDGELSEESINGTVHLLDMAIITAGALDREEIVTGLIKELQSYVTNREDVQLSKRSYRASVSRNERPERLPVTRISVPKLTSPVQEIVHPSLETFGKWTSTSRKPAKLASILEHWPALSTWQKTAYWMDHTFAGRRLVPVEIGRSYVDDGWGQRIMPFRQFLDDYIFDQAGPDAQVGYLAQHDLFRQLPELEGAVATPDYCYTDVPGPEPGTPLSTSRSKDNLQCGPSNDEGSDSLIHKNLWFGPQWTITPLHHDPYHNILCQVAGTKYIRLYSPHHSDKLQPMSTDEVAPHVSRDWQAGHTIDMSNTSTVDVAAMELSPHEDWDTIYPGISKVPYLECLLEAGQALYIPIGWWHYVRSCSVGISVSFWWS